MRMRVLVTEEQLRLIKENDEYQNLMRLASSGNIDNIKTALMISYNYDTETQNKILNYWLNYCNQSTHVDWLNNTAIMPMGNPIDWIPDTIVNLSKAKRITFDYQDITELPDNFGELVNLEELYLGNNFIEELPQSFGGLVNLRYLDLSNNNIEIFPDVIKFLENLSFLNLKGNKIQHVPEFLSKLPNLKYLILKGNNLSEDEKNKVRRMLPHLKNLALNDL